MGWKSTIDITREEAIELILRQITSANNNELSNMLENLGFGDNSDLPYYGNNFYVIDK